MHSSHPRPTWSSGELAMGGLVLGFASGLAEGVGHLVILRLGVLEHAWYPIIWIAAVVNATLLGLAGLALGVLIRYLPPALARTLPVFVLATAAVLPFAALTLKEWIRSYGLLLLILGLASGLTRLILAHRSGCLRHLRSALTMAGAITFGAFAAIQGGAWLHERLTVAALPPPSDRAPDVLMVIIDALRADHLGGYGYSRPTSPTLDRLAGDGVLFEEAYSTSSYTLPSHASLLSGRYPSAHGVEWLASQRLASAAYATLPEVLAARGYRTAAFSGNTFWFTRAQGFGRGFQQFHDFFHTPTDAVLRTAYGRIGTRLAQWQGWTSEDIPARKRADETNAAVLNWAGRDGTRPFLAVVNYMDVHDPYLPPEPFRSRFSATPGPGGLINWEFHVPDRLSPEQLQSEIDAYDGAIAYADDRLGRLIAELAGRRDGRDLVVVVTSDHGEEFGEHGGFLHGAHLYRESIHVPLIVWAPGRIPAGRRVDQAVSHASVPATIVDLIGGEAGAFPVPSLTPLWSDAPPLDWPLPMAELTRRPWAPSTQPVHHGSLRSLIDREWHYIESDTGARALFHLPTDPAEAVNRSDDASLTPVMERFGREVQAAVQAAGRPQVPDAPARPVAATPSPETHPR